MNIQIFHNMIFLKKWRFAARFPILFVFFSIYCQAQDFAKIDPNLAVTQSLFTSGMKFMSHPDSYTPLAEYAEGETKLVACKSWVYDFKYCLLANPKERRLFMGFVDYTEQDSPRLLFGTIIKISDDFSKTPTRIAVRFDMEIDLHTYREPEPPQGKYHFAQGILDYRYSAPIGSDSYNQNTASGLVAQTPSGFYCEQLSWVDFLSFSSGGKGTATQHSTAEGREEYISSYDRRGPRGGYKGTVTSADAVEYSVIIDRTQPISWFLTNIHDGKGKLLKINYVASSTPKITYKYATPHKVMTEIKNAYEKWARSAPLRYVGSEEFIYCGKLAKWIVLRSVDSDWLSAASYLFVPIAGFQIETRSYLDPSQMIKTDVIPQRLMQDMVEQFIK